MVVIVEGKIRGKQRPKVFNGHGVTPKQTVEYENWVKLCYKEQDGRHLEGSIRARIEAHYRIPKSYAKGKRLACKHNITLPNKKPDIDNIAKIILDSLNTIAYEDDSQVVELSVLKRWTEDVERIEFELEEITI